MTAFQYGDICYPSQVEAAQAFVSNFKVQPFVYNNIFYTFQATTQTVDSSGLITFHLRGSSTRSLLDSSPYTFQLQSCDEISSKAIFNKMPVQDMLFAAFFILIFVIGFGQGRGAK